MIYNWIVRVWVQQYISFIIRKPKMAALMYSYVKPVEALHTDFMAKKLEIDRLIKYNSQQKLLASLLNDLFDSTLRRITVVTNDDLIEHTYISRRAETVDPLERVYAYRRSEPPAQKVFVYRRNETDAYADFAVNVPAALLPTIQAALRSRVDYYKTAGKTYKINAI